MMKNLNGIQRAAEIVGLFKGWVEDRHAEQDVLMWTNARGHLNKDMIRKGWVLVVIVSAPTQSSVKPLL